ncbi:MAG: Type prenyl endopeptidase Rce1-like [Frankiaceae bacterium]|nr:Type prenyl endopeptidase Rce1-like [Frankiaceae bacterium]
MTTLYADRHRAGVPATALAVGFAGAIALRVALAGTAGATSLRAGLAFAAVLALFAVVSRPATRVDVRALSVGVAGAVVLVLPVLLSRGLSDVRPAGGYAGWAIATALVASAEEAFLRGALFDALDRWKGPDLAVAGGAVAFALLHVPLYGWHVLPLDLAVGVVLGALRLVAGSWTAPAVAHVGADLAGWWLL